MIIYEYLTPHVLIEPDTDQVDQIIQTRATEGWRLVQLIPKSIQDGRNTWLFIFERPLYRIEEDGSVVPITRPSQQFPGGY